LGIDFRISVEELQKTSEAVLAEKLYDEAYASYISKNKVIVNKTLPLLKQLLKNRGAVVQNILVPFTDGIKQIGVSVNLQESVNSSGLIVISEMEKIITVAIIDQLCKEHLRDMDDLKQSVQNAVYEQKDPLLIYKFEGFEMFKLFIGKVNQETMSLLIKSEIPIQNEHEVKEANQSKSSQKYQESKAETKSALSYQESNGKQAVKTAPIKTQKIASRNTRVSVKYTDGMVKKDIKYKLVEDDLKSNKCILID
jgi:preprotein translocase subunit SecA